MRSGPCGVTSGCNWRDRATPRRWAPVGGPILMQTIRGQPKEAPVHNLAPGALVAINLPVGDYVKGHVGGLTFDLNTIWSTLVACGAVLGLGFYVRVKVTAATPNKVQLFWEVLIGWVS